MRVVILVGVVVRTGSVGYWDIYIWDVGVRGRLGFGKW